MNTGLHGYSWQSHFLSTSDDMSALSCARGVIRYDLRVLNDNKVKNFHNTEVWWPTGILTGSLLQLCISKSQFICLCHHDAKASPYRSKPRMETRQQIRILQEEVKVVPPQRFYPISEFQTDTRKEEFWPSLDFQPSIFWSRKSNRKYLRSGCKLESACSRVYTGWTGYHSQIYPLKHLMSGFTQFFLSKLFGACWLCFYKYQPTKTRTICLVKTSPFSLCNVLGWKVLFIITITTQNMNTFARWSLFQLKNLKIFCH